jgi:hypothetical protein
MTKFTVTQQQHHNNLTTIAHLKITGSKTQIQMGIRTHMHIKTRKIPSKITLEMVQVSCRLAM